MPLSKIVPQISDSPLGKIPNPRMRDYNLHPIPAYDEQLVVWELKRPLLDPFPSFPDDLSDFYDAYIRGEYQQDGDYLIDSQYMLDRIKSFCVEAIFVSLQGNSVEEIGCFCNWLLTLTSLDVVTLYQNLCLKITKSNGYVVTTNIMLHNATGASTNAILLGNLQQSCSALFYVAPYICKNKVALDSCLVALEKAQHHVQQFPSQADNSVTVIRMV